MQRAAHSGGRVLHHLPGAFLVVLERSREQVAALSIDKAHGLLLAALTQLLGNRVGGLRSGELAFDPQVPFLDFPRDEGWVDEIHAFEIEDPLFEEEAPDTFRVPNAVNIVNDELGAINQILLRQNDGQDFGQVTVAGPKWFSAAAQGWGTGGGAGLPPEPVPLPAPGGGLPNINFQFNSQPVITALQFKELDDQPVVVAVLDTSPTEKAATQAGADFLAAAGNTFLQDVVAQVKFAEAPLPSGVIAKYQHIVPYWAKRMYAWAPNSPPANRDTFFHIADHGLFAAGIVHAIAPKAEIHLFRVLDDVGIGDLGVLLPTIRQLPQRLLDGREPRPRLVVNLSLLVEEPNPDAGFKVLPNYRLHRPLEIAINWLTRQGVLVVAAAGNDSLDLNTGQATMPREDPRLPARYDRTLSVAAIDEFEQASNYSNRSDFNATQNGIAVFGGNAELDANTGEPDLEELGNQRFNGIIGAYSHDTLPCNKGQNDTGLVYWAGTSFATPIISGLAATLWPRVGAPAQPLAMLQFIRSLATVNRPDLQCNAIDVTQ